VCARRATPGEERQRRTVGRGVCFQGLGSRGDPCKDACVMHLVNTSMQ
jgi:hypothetical protein